MSILSLERSNARLKRYLVSWRQAAIGLKIVQRPHRGAVHDSNLHRGSMPRSQVLLALSVVWNIGQAARINQLEVVRMETSAQLIQAERDRDRALDDLEKMTVRMEQEQRTAAIPAAVHEVVDAYQYIGECTITSYCPCAVCCGQWADGLTATGIPAEPGIVAVDPEVIPLGSVVVIGGQRYLAADTGVKGLHVDICAAGHQEAEDLGVQTMAVWVESGEEVHG